MQLPRSLIAVTLVGVFAAACGGSPATQGPDGPGSTPGSQATQNSGPGETQIGGGGGGGGSGQYGSVKFQLSGAIEKSGELPFVPPGSMFGGAAGTVLNFADSADNTQIISILVDESGKVVVSYSGTDGQVPAAECTTTDWKIEVQSGSGKFDCTAAMSITGSGAMVEGGKITGEFTAHT